MAPLSGLGEETARARPVGDESEATRLFQDAAASAMRALEEPSIAPSCGGLAIREAQSSLESSDVATARWFLLSKQAGSGHARCLSMRFQFSEVTVFVNSPYGVFNQGGRVSDFTGAAHFASFISRT